MKKNKLFVIVSFLLLFTLTISLVYLTNKSFSLNENYNDCLSNKWNESYKYANEGVTYTFKYCLN